MRDLIYYRPIAQMVQNLLIPEIQKRLNEGKLDDSSLPYEIEAFKIIWKSCEDGSTETIVQLNIPNIFREVEFQLHIEVDQPVQKGDPLREDQVKEYGILLNPEFDGKKAAYWLFFRVALDFAVFFDFKPNDSNLQNDEDIEIPEIRFPLQQYLSYLEFEEHVRPDEQMSNLAINHWPPAPGYYKAAAIYSINAEELDYHNPEFLQLVRNSYTKDHWTSLISFWEETNFFTDRIQYIKTAIERHFAGDYVSSIYTILPQFEGITVDYLQNQGITLTGQNQRIEKLRILVLSRKIILFPKKVLIHIFDYILSGSFWKNSSTIADQKLMVNRHGTLHGSITNFENEALSFKYLILFEAFVFVILHDKIVTNRI